VEELLRDTPTQVLAAIAIVSLLIAVRLQLTAARLRQDLEALDNEKADPRTGLLPQTAIPLRLAPELRWAQHAGKPLGILVFQIYGGHPSRAARALRRAMRGEENGYVLGPGRFAVGLWDSNEEGAAIAVRRLGSAITRAGHTVVDAGLAIYPDDGDDVEELLEIAQQHIRPLDQQERPGRLQPRIARTMLGRFFHVVAHSAVGVVAALGMVAGIHYGMEWLLDPDLQLGDAAAAAVGLCLGAAPFLLATVFWRARTELPRSLSQPERGTRLLLAMAAFMGGLLALSVLEPELVPGELHLPATVVYVATLMLVPFHARYLVRAEPVPMIVSFLAAATLLHFTYDVDPLLANLVRMCVAVTLGCLLARAMERAWWVLVVSAAIALVDIWSVYAPDGVTRNLSEGDSVLLQVLLITGPEFDGQPLFGLGVTDLIFAMVFVAFVHFWKLSVVRTMWALLTGVVAAFLFSAWTNQFVPVLPFLSVAFVAANAARLWQELREAATPDDAPAPQGRKPAPTG
jgi:hypothetical protein